MKYNSLGRKKKINLEKEILNLYDNGTSIKNICEKLNIGRQTVHNYTRKNKRSRYRKHSFDSASFSTFTPKSCYWAGFIAADGCVDKNKTYLRVEININDKIHLTKLSNYTKDQQPYIVYGTKECKFNDKIYNVKYCRIDINSVKIIKDLKNNFNITSAKSFTLLPPYRVPKNLITHYVRGYFDGDGSMYWNKSHKHSIFQVSSGSTKLLSWMSNCIKENVDYNFSKKAFVIRENSSIYFIRQCWSSKYILNWLYKDSSDETRLDRKYKRYIKYCK